MKLFNEKILIIHFRKTSSVGLELQVPFQWDINNIAEDENNLSPEDNSEYFLAILIECLALLNNIPEAIEVSRQRFFK